MESYGAYVVNFSKNDITERTEILKRRKRQREVGIKEEREAKREGREKEREGEIEVE